MGKSMGKGQLGWTGCSPLFVMVAVAALSVSLLFVSPVSHADSKNEATVTRTVPALATPADWLMKMVSAPDRLTYQGIFIYENAAGLMTFQVAHSPIDKVQHERLIYQDGPYQEIIRKGDQVAFIRADGAINRFYSEGMSGLVERIANFQNDLRGSYRLLFGGEDRVAGRKALRIDVQPRDHHRYAYALWLDQETGFMLRSEMMGEKGIVLERLQYADFELVKELPKGKLAPSRAVNWVKKEAPANARRPADDAPTVWDAGWIPSGFEVAGFNRIDSPVSKKKVDSVLYSDGLSAFSVFVEEDESKVLGPASEQIGATSAVSRIFRRGETYYNVTVIGEVPLGTAERVAVSVKPQGTAE
ncbi:MucB/RseB C-terminal domain-containing protein [Sansalvadorimonas verongulae]|uniref:MucB/RseB C-terminal domain-containing protein n=1 Tax=Sansalvadorimonas verongulae TaxID=2172824 RepID=UPI0012BD029F|nr:MucB/RseB C-terminal domain-containing protein [Sansalvadorimonas verongulae]MTI14111.1 hypothetical protein [Sansalvadorimonas verongulae]